MQDNKLNLVILQQTEPNQLIQGQQPLSNGGQHRLLMLLHSSTRFLMQFLC